MSITRNLFIWLILISCSVKANPDSLTSLFKESASIRIKIDAANALAESYLFTDNKKTLRYLFASDSLLEKTAYDFGRGRYLLLSGTYEDMYGQRSLSKRYLKEAIEIFSESREDFQLGLAFYQLSFTHYKGDEYSEAMENALQARNIFRLSGHKLELASSLSLLCDIYSYMGSGDQAINYCIEALEIYDQLDDATGQVQIFNSIGSIYYDLNSYNKAYDYFKKALEFSKELNDSLSLGMSLSNMGEICLSKNQYDSALHYFNSSLTLDKKIANNSGVAYSYYFVGKTYNLKKDFELSISYLDSAFALALQNDNLDLQAKVQIEIGSLQSENGSYKSAIRYLKNALAIAQKIDANPILKICYNQLAKYYDRIGDKSNALIYFTLYMRHAEEMVDQQVAQKIANAEAVYELKSKENEIDLLRARNEIQKLETKRTNLIISILVTAILLLVFYGIIQYRYSRSQKLNNKRLERQRDAIKRQKSEIEKQRDQLTEKSRQIDYSLEYAQKLQLSILPDAALLLRYIPDSFVFFRPRDMVGGDFYWLNPTKAHIYIGVFDCTGHGVPGGFMTMLSKSLLDQVISEDQLLTPSEILKRLDIRLRKSLYQDGKGGTMNDGLVAGIVKMPKKGGDLIYSGARISLFQVMEQKRLREIKPIRRTIGSNQPWTDDFVDHKVENGSNSMFYLTTDGLQDQFGGTENKKFMKSNVKKLFTELADQKISKQRELILNRFSQWKKDVPQTDDVLVLGFKSLT